MPSILLLFYNFCYRFFEIFFPATNHLTVFKPVSECTKTPTNTHNIADTFKMFDIITIVAILMATSVLANPFAAKQTPSDDTQSAYISKLLSNARRLNSHVNNNYNTADLTKYSLKFIKCQFIKVYSQDLKDLIDSGANIVDLIDSGAE